MRKIKFEYRITIVYLILGGVWILFSDKILSYFIKDSETLTQFQTYKGWFYVALTGIIFYYILKKHLEKLRKAEFEAKESDRLKTAFLQNISHEIRTPMNGIIGFAELLGSDDISGEQRKNYLKAITNSSNQLLSVVNDVLDISLIETGNISANYQVLNMNDLLGELYHTFKPMIKKEILFTLEKGLTDKETFINTDTVKVRQVLYNLLNNANKFTDSGFIKIGYSIRNTSLEFFVEDSGIGIAPEVQSKIFERFRKAEKNNFKLYDGVGLGLAICKGNANILGGSISVESEENKGSKFTFSIPYNAVKQQLERKEKQSESKRNTNHNH